MVTKKVKKEKISKKKLMDENIEIAKLIAKTRDKYTCQHCWVKATGLKMHGSHVINEARDHRLACDPYNIKALCYNCHINWWHKNPVEAGEWFRKKWPGRWEKLQKTHIEYMKLGSISITWALAKNEELREDAECYNINLSKFTYGAKWLDKK